MKVVGSQIWEMNPDGTDAVSFPISKEHRRILFFTGWQKDSFHLTNKKYGQRTVDLYPDLPKASGIIVNDLMYKTLG